MNNTPIHPPLLLISLLCLSYSLLIQIDMLFNTTLGFAYAFHLRGDDSSAKAVLSWGIDCMSGLKNPKRPSYVDKINSIYYICLAGAQLKTDSREIAKASLAKAIALAEQLDDNPNYGPDSYRFVTKTEWTFSAVDSLGKTAKESFANIVNMIGDDRFTAFWEEFRE